MNDTQVIKVGVESGAENPRNFLSVQNQDDFLMKKVLSGSVASVSSIN